MKVPTALYRCMRCGHEWFQLPAQVLCQVCSHDYVEWVNFKEWLAEVEDATE